MHLSRQRQAALGNRRDVMDRVPHDVAKTSHADPGGDSGTECAASCAVSCRRPRAQGAASCRRRRSGTSGPPATRRLIRCHKEGQVGAGALGRWRPPTGEDALWQKTVSEVFSSPGTLLGAQRHARADRITSHSRHTDGRHHTEGDQVLLTHTNADRARGVTRGRQRSLAARLQAALVLTDSSMPGLTWTPMISQQSPSPSLQHVIPTSTS